MTRRTSIVTALSNKFNESLTGDPPYKTNIYNNSYPKLKFWDEVQDFPSIYITPGNETREYHPADFKWGYLGISIKVYCRSEESQQELEVLLEDIEKCLDANNTLVYDPTTGKDITEITIISIVTDEGILAPYAVGEINLQVRYDIV
jgi:hypothetical protein